MKSFLESKQKDEGKKIYEENEEEYEKENGRRRIYNTAQLL